MTPTDAQIARAILSCCAERGPGKTICPSEPARLICPEEDAWRALMPEVRRIAADLAAEGRIAVTQKGQPVDPGIARGPIRLGLPQN
ncbi:MAG: DUF3253 domain-containing protein [Pseudomonadota bacterium]